MKFFIQVSLLLAIGYFAAMGVKLLISAESWDLSEYMSALFICFLAFMISGTGEK